MEYSTCQSSRSFKFDARQRWKFNSSGEHHTSERFYNQSAEYSLSYHRNHRTSLDMAGNGQPMNSVPLHQQQNSQPQFDADFTEEELIALKTDRKRYLASGFMYFGAPIETSNIGRQETAATGREETTTYTYHGTTESTADISGMQCCQTCQGQGCSIDHGQIRWAQVMNPNTGIAQDVPVNEDTGTNVNWISPKLVQVCGLKVLKAPPNTGFLDFGGEKHQPKELVKIPLAGKMSKTAHTEFFVAPVNSPINLIVGNRFIQTFGHPHNVFLDKPVGPGSALIMFQQRVTVENRRAVNSRGTSSGRS